MILVAESYEELRGTRKIIVEESSTKQQSPFEGQCLCIAEPEKSSETTKNITTDLVLQNIFQCSTTKVGRLTVWTRRWISCWM